MAWPCYLYLSLALLLPPPSPRPFTFTFALTHAPTHAPTHTPAFDHAHAHAHAHAHTLNQGDNTMADCYLGSDSNQPGLPLDVTEGLRGPFGSGVSGPQFGRCPREMAMQAHPAATPCPALHPAPYPSPPCILPRLASCPALHPAPPCILLHTHCTRPYTLPPAPRPRTPHTTHRTSHTAHRVLAAVAAAQNNEDEYMTTLAHKQIAAFNEGHGWFFWNFRTEHEPHCSTSEQLLGLAAAQPHSGHIPTALKPYPLRALCKAIFQAESKGL